MLITIGITCFNGEKNIENAINSAINQTWKKKEIIIVDDFSQDNSLKIINKYKKYQFLKIIRNSENKGVSFSRNKIIKESKAEIIIFMDDDDYSELNRIELQTKKILQSGYPNKKFIACCASMERKYKTGYKRVLISMGINGRLPIKNELANFLLFFEKKKGVDYGFGLPTSSLAITKDCFRKVGYFDESLERVEDMDLSIRLSLEGVIFTSVKDVLVRQESNTNIKKTYLNFLSEVKLIKKYKNYLENKKLFFHSLQWPYLRYFYFIKSYRKALITLILLLLRNPLRTIIHFCQTGIARILLELRIYKKNFFK